MWEEVTCLAADFNYMLTLWANLMLFSKAVALM